MGQSAYKIPGRDGSLYEGQCSRTGKYHGKGKLKYEDCSCFEGEFENGMPVDGLFTYKNGDTYQGTLKNCRPEGFGKWTNSQGIYEGNFKDAKFVNGTIHFRDGSRYKGFMQNGKRHGPTSEYIFSNGDKFMGQFEDDQFVEGVYENVSGERYEGEFKDGKMDGRGKLFAGDKLAYEGDFKDDLFHGKGKFYKHEKGVVYDG